MSSGVVTDAKAKFEGLLKLEWDGMRPISPKPGGERMYEKEPPIPPKPMLGDGASAPRATLLAWLMLYREIWQLQSWWFSA